MIHAVAEPQSGELSPAGHEASTGESSSIALRDGLELLSVLGTGLARRYSGTLRVDASSGRGRVHLYNGHVAWAAWSSHPEHLGDVLRREAGVEPAVFAAAMERCRTSGRKLGHVLIGSGILAHADLRRCLRLHVANHLRGILDQEGPFAAAFELEPHHHYDLSLVFSWAEILEAVGYWR